MAFKNSGYAVASRAIISDDSDLVNAYAVNFSKSTGKSLIKGIDDERAYTPQQMDCYYRNKGCDELFPSGLELFTSAFDELLLSPIKNLAAGVINAVVPGSDLGDSNSDLRNIGNVAGSLVDLVVPGGLITTVANQVSKVSFLSNIISKASTVVSTLANPASIGGKIVQQAVSTFAPALLQSAFQTTFAPQQAVAASTQNVELIAGPKDFVTASANAVKNAINQKVSADPSGNNFVTVSKDGLSTGQSMPWYAWLAIGFGALLLLPKLLKSFK